MQLSLPLDVTGVRGPGSGVRDRGEQPGPSRPSPAAAFEIAPSLPLDARLPGPGEAIERASTLARRLSADLGMRVRLWVTDNRTTMVSFRRRLGALDLRVHHMFLDAPEPVARALADYAGRARRRAGRVIDAYVRARSRAIRPPLPHERPRPVRPQGRHHDLRRIFDAVNACHFAGAVRARIGWGEPPARRRRRTIRMGVYDHETGTIRIHPALDRPEVPEYFVAYLVFHEMLHQVIPARPRRGRREHHGAEFRRAERRFPDYDRALAWERQHLDLLLGA